MIKRVSAIKPSVHRHWRDSYSANSVTEVRGLDRQWSAADTEAWPGSDTVRAHR